MSISLYSVLTTFLWFNVFVLLLCVLRWKLKILLGYQLFPLLLLIGLSVVRLLAPVETFFALEVESTRVLPFLRDELRAEVLVIGKLSISAAQIIVLSCSLVSIILLGRLLCLFQKKTKELKSGIQTDDVRILALFERIKEETPSKRKCFLHVSDNCPGPCIFGVTYSVILVPGKMRTLSDRDLYYVLKHEWRHHLEHDVAVKLLIEGLCCVMWWNPLMYILKHNLNQTLELKCDAKVTREMDLEGRLSYAESILNAVGLCGKEVVAHSDEPQVLIPFLGTLVNKKATGDGDILQRFDAVLESRSKYSKGIGQIIGVALVLMFAVSFCFVLQPYSLPAVEDLTVETKSENTVGPFRISPETSFLVDNQDGTYSLFVDGEYLHNVEEQAIESEMFQSIPIIGSDET